MTDEGKTKPELIAELQALRLRVAELEQLETRCQQAEELLRTMFDKLPMGIYITQDGHPKMGNAGLRKLTGYSEGESVGREMPSFVLAEDRPMLRENAVKMLRGERTSPYEYRLLTKEGRIKWVMETVASIQYRGRRAVLGSYIDITEHKQAEQLFRGVFDSSPVGIYIIQDGKIQMVNPAILKLTGYSEAEALGKESLSLVLPEDREMVRASAVKILSGGHSWTYEYRLLDKAGKVKWVMESLSSIQYQGRRAVLGSYIDITEHKQAEQALQESESLYRSLFNNMLNGFAYCKMLFEKDKPPDFVYISVNSAFEVLTGLKNVVGKKVSEVIPGIQKSDPELLEIYGRVALSGTPERFETYVRALEMWFSISVYSPAKEYFVAVFDVITERKQALEALEAQKEMTDRILASTPSAILVINRKLEIVMANQTFTKIFNLAKEKIEGKSLKDVLPVDGLLEAISRTVADQQFQSSLEFTYEGANGEMILLALIVPMAVDEVLLTFQDVTMERARQEQQHHIDRLASIGEVAAGVAHELNNPLVSVIGYSELLLSREVSQDVHADVEVIHRNAQRSVTIVRNLLAFARHQEPHAQRFSINDTVCHVLEMRSYELKASNIVVVTELADKLPDVLADLQQIKQVFFNIILNAEQAMLEAHNRGTLIVKTNARMGMVIITFSDDGPGITATNLRRMFTPFFTTKEPGKGTGLGLSICHGIITRHGGRIYVESKAGEGATFFIELPAAEAEVSLKTDEAERQGFNDGEVDK